MDERFSGSIVVAAIAVAAASAGISVSLQAKNDVHDALHFTEPFRVQFVGRLDVFVISWEDFVPTLGGAQSKLHRCHLLAAYLLMRQVDGRPEGEGKCATCPWSLLAS